MIGQIKVINNCSRYQLKTAIFNVIEQIGGIKNFVKSGETVFLKTNFNTDDRFPASTDLMFLRTMVEIIYEAGAKQVIIGDCCTFTMNTRKVMKSLKIFDLEKMKPAPRILVFNQEGWVNKSIKNGRYLKSVKIPAILDKIDRLILLPCLKTHIYAQYTGALKLSVGFMKPSQRLRLHLGHLQEKIAELNLVIKPDLVVMDARKCFITRGPIDGEIREPNLLLASAQRIAIDIEGIKIIQSYQNNDLAGIEPEKLIQIKWAKKVGIY